MGMLGAMHQELNIARRYLPAGEFNNIEKKLMQAEGEVNLRDYDKARASLAEAMTHVTTVGDRSMSVLRDAGLI